MGWKLHVLVVAIVSVTFGHLLNAIRGQAACRVPGRIGDRQALVRIRLADALSS